MPHPLLVPPLRPQLRPCLQEEYPLSQLPPHPSRPASRAPSPSNDPSELISNTARGGYETQGNDKQSEIDTIATHLGLPRGAPTTPPYDPDQLCAFNVSNHVDRQTRSVLRGSVAQYPNELKRWLYYELLLQPSLQFSVSGVCPVPTCLIERRQNNSRSGKFILSATVTLKESKQSLHKPWKPSLLAHRLVNEVNPAAAEKARTIAAETLRIAPFVNGSQLDKNKIQMLIEKSKSEAIIQAACLAATVREETLKKVAFRANVAKDDAMKEAKVLRNTAQDDAINEAKHLANVPNREVIPNAHIPSRTTVRRNSSSGCRTTDNAGNA